MARAKAAPKEKAKRNPLKGWPKNGGYSHRSPAQREALLELLGPERFFPCDHPWIAQKLVVPGRKGGRVTGCATPKETRPREPFVWVGDGDRGRAMRSRTVRDRLRARRDPRRAMTARFDAEDAAQAIALAVDEFRLYSIPAPVGRLHRGRPGSSRCDRTHPVWDGYDEALEEADAIAASRFEDPREVKESKYREVLRAVLQSFDPQRFKEWDEVTRACIDSYERAVPRNRGYESPQAEAARRRRAWLERGGDTGAGDYFDSLAMSTQQAKRRKERGATPKKRAKKGPKKTKVRS